MLHESFFVQVNSEELASWIGKARSHVCYAAPGIQKKPASALIELAKGLGPEHILVFLDVDENVIRMGYGEIEAIVAMREAGILVQHIAGLRSGLVVIDDQGFSFTPTALYLEREATGGESLNAMRLTPDQVREAMARLSPASKAIAVAQANTHEERKVIEEAASETKPESVEDDQLRGISTRLKTAPPASFDVSRQVRVFQAYFQYVELSLTGAAIQRHKFTIPEVLQNIGFDKEFEGRMKTTFDLIGKDSEVSSKELEQDLHNIRNNFTKSLGGKNGRVILRAARPRLEKRIQELRDKIKEHSDNVKNRLDEVLNKSKKMMVDYYFDIVRKNPPDQLYGLFGNPSEKDIKCWLDDVISKGFPKVNGLVNNINLDVIFKDVTFEALNDEGFLKRIKEAYSDVDWDKPYEEYLAAGESMPKEHQGK